MRTVGRTDLSPVLLQVLREGRVGLSGNIPQDCVTQRVVFVLSRTEGVAGAGATRQGLRSRTSTLDTVPSVRDDVRRPPLLL